MLELFQKLTSVTDPYEMQSLLPVYSDEPSLHFYWKDKHGKLLGSNISQAKKLSLNTSSELVGHNDFDFVVEASAIVLRRNDKKIISSKQHGIFFEKAQCLDGVQWQGISYKTPLLSLSKKICGIMGISILVDKINQYKLVSQLLSKQEVNSEVNTLTTRQIDCLYYLVKGMGLKEIACVMNLSPRTIEHHFENIKIKLNCNSRSGLVAKALQLSCIKERL